MEIKQNPIEKQQDVKDEIFDLNIKDISIDEKMSKQFTIIPTGTCFCSVATCIRC